MSLPFVWWSWRESWCAVGLADNPVLGRGRDDRKRKKEAIKASLWSWAESNRRPNS